jgi:hypothetical protein
VFVYVWKDASETPFYVGFTKNRRRANPRNGGGRNWLCKQKLLEIGIDKVIVELRPVSSIEDGITLERLLIAKFGRIQTENGPLTNLTSGGDGTHTPTFEHREILRKAMLDPNHPARSEAAKAKQRKRMKDPEVRALFSGDANPAKRPEVRAKIKAKWDDPTYREARRQEKIGKTKHSEAHKQKLRDRLLDKDNPIREYHKVLNSDPVIKAKRVATLQTPIQRKRQSDAMKAYWAKRKSATGSPI